MTQADAAAMASLVKDGLTAIAAAVAAFVALFGLKAWKRQLHGNAEYELARRLLRATYKLREAVNPVRSPFMSGVERESALEAAGLKDLPPPEREKRASGAAYQARWNLLSQARIEFDAEFLEAEALWGPEMKDLAVPIQRCRGELYAALVHYLNHRTPEVHAASSKNIAIVFAVDNDEYTERLHAAVAGIESSLRPHLKV